MSVGDKPIIWDGKPAWVRVCWVRAWDDPEWRQVNGLPPKKRGGALREKADRTDRPAPAGE